jgi:hypothetical protein
MEKLMSEFTQLSFSQSNLVYYNTNAANPGIFIEWERYTLSGVYSYKIFRSDYFDGTYTEIDEVLFPINEYVDGGGAPSSFYKIQEIGNDLTTVLSTSAPINGDELLIKSSLRFELEHLLNIPIYDEEVLFRRGRTQATVAFPFWNFYPRPEVRITGSSNEGDQDAMFTLSEYDPIYKTINSDYDPILYSIDGTITNYTSGNNYSDGLKYKCDYMGNIYFVKSDGTPQTIQSYDTVFVSYNVKAFTSQHMNSSLNMALQVINAQPGASKYPSIASVPYYYDPALVFGAAYYLLRSLLVQLTQRQRRLLLEDPDASVFSNIKETAGMYKEDFDKLLEKLPISRYPGIRGIVVPEFNMPGGRSRFFRYIWNIGGAN